jgi:hypothetical protein
MTLVIATTHVAYVASVRIIRLAKSLSATRDD